MFGDVKILLATEEDLALVLTEGEIHSISEDVEEEGETKGEDDDEEACDEEGRSATGFNNDSTVGVVDFFLFFLFLTFRADVPT